MQRSTFKHPLKEGMIQNFLKTFGSLLRITLEQHSYKLCCCKALCCVFFLEIKKQHLVHFIHCHLNISSTPEMKAPQFKSIDKIVRSVRAK
eukprot:1533869-Ditylum_brightwellii.AAC.1